MDLYLILGGAVMFAGVVIAIVMRQSGLDAIAADLADDPDVEAVPGRWMLKLRTRPPRRNATVTAAGGSRGNPPRWNAQSQVHLEPSTTLSLAPKGILGGLRAAFGAPVQIGDEAFERAFAVRGSEPEAVKSLLSSREAKFAVETLFAHEVSSLRIDGEGIVTCAARRDGLSAGQPKRLLCALVALCDELEAASARGARRPSSGT